MADNQPRANAALPPRHRLLWLVSLAVVLALVLAGVIWALTRSPSSGSSGRASVPETSLTPTNAPTPTPTPAASRVVYTADWSHGARGWVLPPSVQVKSGHLVFTGTGDVSLTIPYQPPVTGYTVEVGMEIDSVNTASMGGTITIAGQGTSGNSQYFAQLLCVGRQGLGCRGGQITVGTEGGVFPTGMQVSDFDTGPYESTYQVHVGASNVQFCDGQSCHSADFVKVSKTAIKLVLQDDYLQMVVSSVAISIP
ncbi:MAG: hypothetical protein ACLQUY_05000 [Ktedonobacterales bacterium]